MCAQGVAIIRKELFSVVTNGQCLFLCTAIDCITAAIKGAGIFIFAFICITGAVAARAVGGTV
jgi:hypothetical protein